VARDSNNDLLAFHIAKEGGASPLDYHTILTGLS